MSSDQEKDQLARLGKAVSSLPTAPARSANVMVLHDVLAVRLPAHDLGLGRLQFEKHSFPLLALGASAATSAAW